MLNKDCKTIKIFGNWSWNNWNYSKKADYYSNSNFIATKKNKFMQNDLVGIFSVNKIVFCLRCFSTIKTKNKTEKKIFHSLEKMEFAMKWNKISMFLRVLFWFPFGQEKVEINYYVQFSKKDHKSFFCLRKGNSGKRKKRNFFM